MEYENLFVSSRWEILEYLSRENLSPLQLSEKLNTSVANVSQQLRLLEMAGIVATRKIKNRDKGKPRTLYCLSNDFMYIIALKDGYAGKKLIRSNGIHNVISRILTYKDSNLHYFLLKLFFLLDNHLQKISALVYDIGATTLNVFCRPNSNLALPKSYSLAYSSLKMNIKVKVLQKIPVLNENFFVIYDPENKIQKQGGIKK